MSETLLAHFMLDVSPEDLFKNLSDHRKARTPFSRQKPYWVPAIFVRKFILAISEGMAALRP
jgi:hypothetical protein